MPSFETTRRVNHSSSNMFDLVADVERYTEFVPLCETLVVRGRKARPDGTEILVADMTVAYKVFRETFTTKVTLNREANEILVEYLDGPVSELENKWSFKDEGEGTSDIIFKLDYEFKSRAFAALMGTVFDRAFRRFAEAFEDRADKVYASS
ncbi:MAG: SRPBCC family protein [Hyphomicrobiales bacterium]